MYTMQLLLIAFMLATASVLAVGIVGFIRGGEFNRKYGNTLMRWRVILQGIAIMLLGLMFLYGR